MPVPGLTPRRVRAAIPKQQTYTIWDDRPRGLGLKVAPTGRRTFVVNATRDGVRHIETIGDASELPLKEARSIAADRIEAHASLRRAGPETPFEAMAELAIRRNERLWKPGTTAVARRYLASYILPYFKGMEIAAITRRDVEDWFTGLGSRPGAANRSAPVLSVIMREAEELGARPEGGNPVAGLRRYRRPRKERVLTPGEMARLGAALEAGAAKRPMETALVRLIVLTGCRKGELLNLNWRDYRDGHLHLRDSKTGPKMVFLSSHARKVLEGIGPKRTGPVFPPPPGARGGFPLDYFWNKLRREVDIGDVRLHDLRHHYASVAVRMGVSLSVIGTLLGHNKPETTMGYAHLDDGMMRDAVKVVGKAIAGGKGVGQ